MVSVVRNVPTRSAAFYGGILGSMDEVIIILYIYIYHLQESSCNVCRLIYKFPSNKRTNGDVLAGREDPSRWALRTVPIVIFSPSQSTLEPSYLRGNLRYNK